VISLAAELFFYSRIFISKVAKFVFQEKLLYAEVLT